MNINEIVGNIIVGVIIVDIMCLFAGAWYLEKIKYFDPNKILLFIIPVGFIQTVLFYIICFVIEYFWGIKILTYRF
jgi:hypothetical protein